MCYSIAYLEKKFSKLAERYKDFLPVDRSPEIVSEGDASAGLLNHDSELPVYYFVSGFSHPALPVVGTRGIELKHWGLIPYWTRDIVSAREIRSKTLNAKAETVFAKPSFREAVRIGRALLPVHGFFEWHTGPNAKTPYFIKAESAPIFSLACVTDTWVDTNSGESMHTFSILTTAANTLMGKIHNTKNRMPVILAKEDEHLWLNPTTSENQIQEMLRPFPSEKLMAFQVSRKLNNPRIERNLPFAINPLSYDIPEPGQERDLFSQID